MRSAKRHNGSDAAERRRLEELLLRLQRERIALTCAIMRLQGGRAVHRPREVMRIIVALLRLQRTNRQTMAMLGVTSPTMPTRDP